MAQEAQESQKMMMEALARRRGKFAGENDKTTDMDHKDNMVDEHGKELGGHSTEGEQDDYQRQVNQGMGNEAPEGKTPEVMSGVLKDNGGARDGMDDGHMNGNTDLSEKELQEIKEAELMQHSLGSSNATGLRGKMLAGAQGKLDNMKAMREKRMAASPMSKGPMKY